MKRKIKFFLELYQKRHQALDPGCPVHQQSLQPVNEQSREFIPGSNALADLQALPVVERFLPFCTAVSLCECFRAFFRFLK
jgi:hypothetical protein